MIRKIEQLASIGKFRNYKATGDVSFSKLTLFYADNGIGKTTLAAVLRSLTLNQPEIITKRISTDHTTPQTAQIIERDTQGIDTYYTFRTTGWSHAFPNIEIFDIHFVHDNVYSGFDFNDEQRKRLHEFIVGAQGIAVKQNIEQNKVDKTTSRQLQAAMETQILQKVENALNSESITEFLNTSANEAQDIDNKIAFGEVALRNAQANAIIQTLQPLIKLNNIDSGLDFETIISDLQTTTQTIQNEALQSLFQDHCTDLEENSIEGSEAWLKIGFNYLMEKRSGGQDEILHPLMCPFCKQPVSTNLDIVNAYTLRFNDDFNILVQNIQKHSEALQSFNLELTLQSLNSTNHTNADRINSWSSHLPKNVQTPSDDIIPNEEALKTEFQELIKSVQRKSQNPSVALDTVTANTFRTSLEIINNNINVYNQSISAHNNSIVEFRASIQTEQQEQDQLNRLRRIKKRFEPAIKELCAKLATERQNLRTLEQTYTQLVQQQQEAATAFFTNYRDRINYYLDTVFKTPFRVANVSHIPPRGRAIQSRIDYNLTIDGHVISFNPDEPTSARHCLSEGDKSTIAFAFFLSKLDIDPGKADKILVFDDPLSSFDSNRRLYTVQIIRDLFTQMKQVIVLSHNAFFLHEITKGVSRSDRKTLCILENITDNAAIIESLDLDALVEIDYFKHIKELESFLRQPSISNKERVLGLMRNILEAHICFKFYKQTQGIPRNDRTFGRLIDELENRNVVFRSDTTPPSVISKLRLINTISCKPHHGEPEPDYRSIGVDPDTMCVAELSNFVQDTLDLIDNRL